MCWNIENSDLDLRDPDPSIEIDPCVISMDMEISQQDEGLDLQNVAISAAREKIDRQSNDILFNVTKVPTEEALCRMGLVV